MNARANSNWGVRTRIATAVDVSAMTSVVNAAFAVESFIEGTRTDSTGMNQMMQNGEFLVAENESARVVACVYTEIHGERGYFGMLAVDPSAQGTGMGRLMVESAENHCRQRGCQWMDITVLSVRPELLPFYRQLGYVEARTEEFRSSRPLKEGIECHSIILSKVL
jgi:ribosomal protein S18 acetylase RimI-like enzyme